MNRNFETTATRGRSAGAAGLLLWLLALLLPALAAAQGVYPSPEALPALTLRVTGTVYAIAPYGDGYVLGGQFDRINGEPRRNIALIGPDGALLDAGFDWIDEGANAIVHQLVVSGDSVYAVGDFTRFNGAARHYVAKLSLADGSLDGGFAPVPNAPVRALATDGAGGVFLGGDFSAVNGTPRDNSAKVDASGAVTAWVAGYKDASVVHAIGYDALSGKVYVGGNLRIGGLHRAVARLDGVSGAADPAWKLKVNPRGTPQVFAITLSDDHVYLGGQFSRLANVNRANIARVDRSSGDIDTGWNPGANSAVRSILIDGDGIIAGGDFTRIGGADHQRLARIAADGLADPAFVVNADRPVRAIVASASGLLVGGAFRTLNGAPEEGLARLVGYVSDPTFTGTVGGPGQVDAFAFAADGGVFVGGVFDFTAEAKDLLLDTVPAAQLLSCSRRVGERMATLVGRSPDFPAWLLTPSRQPTPAARPQPFAHIGQSLLARLGRDSGSNPPEPSPQDDQAAVPHPAIVVLTTLSLEYDAVRAHLTDFETLVHPSGTYAERGRLPGTLWYVTLVNIGVGNFTAAVLTERFNTWLSPQALLFVGIAGGLGSAINIGDVVVATKMYGIHRGKQAPEGFVVRSDAWRASYRLEQVARHALRVAEYRVHFKPIAIEDVVHTSAEPAIARRIRERYDDVVAIEALVERLGR